MFILQKIVTVKESFYIVKLTDFQTVTILNKMNIHDFQTVTSLRSQIKNEQKSFELKNDRNVVTNSDLN